MTEPRRLAAIRGADGVAGSTLARGRRAVGIALAATMASAAWRRPAQAQQKTMPAVGFLSIASATGNARFYERFVAGLRDLGYVDGRTVRIEARFADEDRDRLADHAAELVRQAVDVIVTYAGVGVAAARKATSTIPIVVAVGPDLVGLGYAASFARPGGNVTGLRYLAGDSFNKRLEFLKEIDPAITRVGVLFQRASPFATPTIDSMRPTANALGLELRPQEASGVGEYGGAFAAWTDANVTGLVLHDNPEFVAYAQPIVALAMQHRMRSIGSLEHTASGGLMAYSVDFEALAYRSASFVDRIIKGAKPGDLPIEQPTRFPLVINLATARRLGLVVPPALLARADELIE